MGVETNKEQASALNKMKTDMYIEVLELLGKGYAPDYCEQIARGFIHIAMGYAGAVLEANKVALKASKA